ncbi:acyltransferase [Conexibacter sp. SYSU D00693]|uniref:acyltransferase family protein n=1 Tax=Conexibacter sp. SYSU D00693 TaxID=2812560 RepID=UPI00196AD104|nr:acyltransferase [Conexibacter sp. SYSU D00693]
MEVHQEVATVRSQRLRGVEGLRALAATAVLVHHVGAFVSAPDGQHTPMHPGLWAGVVDLRAGLTLFFVLSGFLLYRPIASALLRGRPLPSARRYLRHRALRILPAYWVILLVTAFVLQQVITRGEGGVGMPKDAWELIANLLLLQPYDPDTVFTGIGPAWSLSVEVAFYVLLPILGVLGALVVRRGGASASRRATAALVTPAVLLLVGLVGKAFWHFASDDLGRWEYSIGQTLPINADLFGYGALAAFVWVAAVDGLLRIPDAVRRALLPAAVVLAGATFLVAGYGGVLQNEPGDTVLGMASALLVLGVTLPGRSWLGDLLQTRPFEAVGLASYSIYLWHTPVIFLFVDWGLDAPDKPALVVAFLAVAAATGVLSAITYLLVERPFLRMKSRDRPQAPAIAPAEGTPPVAAAEPVSRA